MIFLSIYKKSFALLNLLFLVSLLSVNTVFAQLGLGTTKTPNQLIQDVLVGNGVTVNSVTYKGASSTIGQFSNGQTTNLGLSSGIILSTGNVMNAGGPVSIFASDAFTTGGDPQLSALIPNYTIYDAAVLEFNFIPISDTIKFRYVFGSEEYPEYVCSEYNDVFGFFVTGPNPIGGSYTNKNIALIPGTSLPVAINSLNIGVAGGLYNPSNCTSLAYSMYYVDNEGLGGTTIVYDGFTTVLTATCLVVPCKQYHIKIAIGDAGDNIYDSNVFLEANSFTSPSFDISASASTNDSIMVEGCGAGTFTFIRTGYTYTSHTLHYLIEGSALNGVDYQDLNGNSIIDSVVFAPGQNTVSISINPIMDGMNEGDETIIISIPQIISCEKDTLRAKIYIKNVDPLEINTFGDDTIICPLLGDLTTITTQITGGYGPFTYSWRPNQYIYKSNFDSSIISVNPPNTSKYTVTVTDTCGNSSSSSSTTVRIECPIEIPNVFTPNGDGTNEYFHVKHLEMYPNSELVIFNRWGKKVYESKDYKNDWDGNDCPDGVYYYILNHSKGDVYHGTVTLIR